MVIVHVFIIKNYPNLFSNYYPNFTFLGHLPLYIAFWRIYIQSHFPGTLTNRTRGNRNILLFWYHFSDRDTMISKKDYKAIISIICT